MPRAVRGLALKEGDPVRRLEKASGGIYRKERKPWPAAPKQKKLIMASSGNPNAACGDHFRKSPAHSFLLDKPIPVNYWTLLKSSHVYHKTVLFT